MVEAGWIAVSLSEALERGAAAGAIVDGKEVAVWRDNAGAAHVWEDRCPHRGMRMSFGFVRGDRLACLYHGWQFDGAGQCRAIPAHPDLEVPATIKVSTFPVTEACGFVWTSLAGEAPPALALDAAEATPVRSLYLDVPLAEAIAALAAAAVPAFAGPADAKPVLAPVAGATGVWMLAVGDDRLLIAGQSVDASHSALHVAVLGGAATYAGAGQKHFARWAEQFRLAAESRWDAAMKEAA
jgi:nitrite reductase/ring-hydroxylating ferredoxin subunit